MPHKPTNWFTGDDMGNIKLVTALPGQQEDLDPRQPALVYKPMAKVLHQGQLGQGIQRMSLNRVNDKSLVRFIQGSFPPGSLS